MQKYKILLTIVGNPLFVYFVYVHMVYTIVGISCIYVIFNMNKF